jgi:phenylalanyl-tRNA synthetase alpha chain
MDIVGSLGSSERSVLSALKGKETLDKLKESTGLSEVEVVRALQWLSNKGLVTIEKTSIKCVALGGNGEKYLQQNLPERTFLSSLQKGRQTPEGIPLDKEELSVSIGVLKRLAAIEVLKPLAFELTAHGKKLLEKKTLEEEFLATLAKPRPIDSMRPEEKLAFDNLLSRKDILKITEDKTLCAELTPAGKGLGAIKAEKLIGRLSQVQIMTGEWRKARFKGYDISSPVPAVSGGRRHILSQAREYIRRIWIEMGFKEMSGGMVQTSFWNFDALFTAQDHPVREIHDTFFIGGPAKGSLPDEKLVSRVKRTHENGGDTGSKGWEYRWDKEVARQNCMRTHTTCLSARTIAGLKPGDIPGKFFSVARNFRNETIDWGHSFEFFQVEGIVVGKGVTFRHLLGYLKQYYGKLGYPNVRFRPSYFPYTEMSVESEVYLEDRKKWLEVGGAGILRPEVVKPLLGQDVPVLAWGQGLERGIMEHIGLSDLREVYSNNLAKERRVWFK